MLLLPSWSLSATVSGLQEGRGWGRFDGLLPPHPFCRRQQNPVNPCPHNASSYLSLPIMAGGFQQGRGSRGGADGPLLSLLVGGWQQKAIRPPPACFFLSMDPVCQLQQGRGSLGGIVDGPLLLLPIGEYWVKLFPSRHLDCGMDEIPSIWLSLFILSWQWQVCR